MSAVALAKADVGEGKAAFSHKGRRKNQATVKNGNGAPSVGLNTTFTF